ncbi:hypothetical protein [Geodermatophilus marinus]|uniref:hypothetical protein n=1 Tax=Geodermatophilus sp. LHW52908 TaxID=2303986 RepID=UPI0011C0D53E|nr:hypothetical protein [Geodermatophilus sp. LHW52908]
MSMPTVPGFLEPSPANTLADLWNRPTNLPGGLWPLDDLRTVARTPAGWLVLEEHFFTEDKHGGRGCVTVKIDQTAEALRETTWIGRDLGKVSIWGDGTFEGGLAAIEGDIEVRFFAHARRPSGAPLPVIEISHTFLWYWDAFPTSAGWKYLNRAGREQDLLRWELTEDSWRVEVRALEMRQYLSAAGLSAVLQLDYINKTDGPEIERVDDVFVDEWAHFHFYADHDTTMGDRPVTSGIMGQYVLTGLRTSKVPRFEERRQDREYATFIYGLDPETGQPLTHTCDPDQLGTYYDRDGTRLHYLTPIYFRREVLQPYAAEPTRYRLSSSRLTCLDLWGIDLSFNSIGLVEVYLGDLGRDLPSDEWGHWRTYNVPPEGKMDEGRFRRDFLNQFASSRDVMGDLRRARESANAASQRVLGAPLWKALDGDIKAEFDSLIGPVADDPVSLGPALLILTKSLIDGIDVGPLKGHLSAFDKGDQSLRLLQRFANELGDTTDCTAILRHLQSFRSKGGVAHLAGSQQARAAESLGVANMASLAAFESVAGRLVTSLQKLTELMVDAVQKSESAAEGEPRGDE